MAFRQQQYVDYSDGVPDKVKQFVVYFYRHIRERNIPEIFSMYEVSFAKLSEMYFQGTTWPPVQYISGLVDDDSVFCLLYKEMFFRHLYATVQPTLQQRCESWDNYCALFNIILGSSINMQLPNGWLWDMVDEFVYQFQSWQQYRGKLSTKSAEEMEALRSCDNVWSILSVLNYLQALADKSGITEELSTAAGQEHFYTTEGYEQGTNVLRIVGYFSLVGLLRVHTLVGDYHGALKALGVINPFQRNHLFTPKIATCNISLYYYAGFCYLLLRRYTDAARTFNIILNYISRVKQYHSRSAQYEQILKKNEQMYALTAITLALCPAAQRELDETVMNTLKDKYNEKMGRMVRGVDSTYEELFAYACPKFITAAPPNLDAPSSNTNQEAYRLQLRCFQSMVQEQQHLPSLKQLLKLYTAISLPKLASLMDMNETTLRSQLMLLKMTGYCTTWSGEGDAASGSRQVATEIDFHTDIDEDGVELVTVKEVEQVRRQGEFLGRHITKFKEIVRDLNMPPPTPAEGGVAARPRPALAGY
ncbi:g12696 [Coccomyxa viridis]|uniref:Eukaryotic translation initiation factor 3 subunit L n=1 Tax=Coccomyxa viridis TaxID=1274662 RepID=A0ABP1GDM7_9CHLO